MEDKHTLDRLDREILRLIQHDASLSNQEISDRIGLSPSPCLRRLRHLHEAGYIKKEMAILDRRALNLNLVAIVGISMDRHTADRFAGFEEAIEAIPEIIECFVVTGQKADYLIKVVVPDMDRYEHILLRQINTIEGVKGVHTSFQLRDVFDHRPLPLHYLSHS